MKFLIIRRLLSAIPLLLVLSMFCFALVRAIPGDPVDVLLGNSQRDVPASELAILKKEFGLNEPWPKQYLTWLSGFVGKGELGRSYRDGRPVLQVICDRIPATIALTACALILAFAGGLVSGLVMSFCATRSNLTIFGNALMALTIIVYSTPSFWLALMALFVFTQWTNWAPVLAFYGPGEQLTIQQLVSHVWLPAVVLSARRGAKVALFVRASILDELLKPYVLYARSKGLGSMQIFFKHIFKNSLMPVISLLGLSLPALLGGAVLVETIFAWPGLGRLVVESTFGRNYPVLLALTVIYGMLVVVANLISDILSYLVDPRLSSTLVQENKTGAVHART